jgi:pyridoxal phosphate enzyme (YggS family)
MIAIDPVCERLERTRQRIAEAERNFGRTAGSVQLLAVSKTKSAAMIRTARGCGQRRFGESYAQEALIKMQALRELDIEWHFIGPIQSNKTRDIASHFAWVHSVDRLKIATRLNDQRPEGLPPLQCCLQVNISGEASKSGLSLSELPAIAAAVARMPRLALRGLMAIPAPEDDLDRQRQPYRSLRRALDKLRAGGLALDTLSMGMTADLEAAIAEGATLVRVGTAIFGPRERP